MCIVHIATAGSVSPKMATDSVGRLERRIPLLAWILLLGPATASDRPSQTAHTACCEAGEHAWCPGSGPQRTAAPVAKHTVLKSAMLVLVQVLAGSLGVASVHDYQAAQDQDLL